MGDESRGKRKEGREEECVKERFDFDFKFIYSQGKMPRHPSNLDELLLTYGP